MGRRKAGGLNLFSISHPFLFNLVKSLVQEGRYDSWVLKIAESEVLCFGLCLFSQDYPLLPFQMLTYA